MTIVSVIANRPEQGAGKLILVADTRLIVEGAAADGFPKIIDISPGVAVAIAGSTLPFAAACEIVRSLVLSTNIKRVGDGMSVLDAWDVSRMIGYFASTFFDALDGANTDRQSEAMVCGFARDGVPCIIRMVVSRDGRGIRVYRPASGTSTRLAMGSPEVVPLVRTALSTLGGSGPAGFRRFLSLLRAIVEHNGTPFRGVGGTLSIASLARTLPCLAWNGVRMDGRVLLRGISVPSGMFPDDGIYDVDADTGWLDELDRMLHTDTEPSPVASGQLASIVCEADVFNLVPPPIGLVLDAAPPISEIAAAVIVSGMMFGVPQTVVPERPGRGTDVLAPH